MIAAWGTVQWASHMPLPRQLWQSNSGSKAMAECRQRRSHSLPHPPNPTPPPTTCALAMADEQNVGTTSIFDSSAPTKLQNERSILARIGRRETIRIRFSRIRKRCYSYRQEEEPVVDSNRTELEQIWQRKMSWGKKAKNISFWKTTYQRTSRI